MLDWVLESQALPATVCLVFFEAMMHDPGKEIKRVADFLELPYYDDLIGIILKDAVHDGLASAAGEGGGGGAARMALRRMSTRRKSTAAAAGARKSGGRQQGGATGASPAKPLTVGTGAATFSPEKVSRARLAWVPIAEKVKGADTYGALYELLYGRKYPYATAKAATDGGGCVVS
jgi:hypothetical protein